MSWDARRHCPVSSYTLISHSNIIMDRWQSIHHTMKKTEKCTLSLYVPKARMLLLGQAQVDIACWNNEIVGFGTGKTYLSTDFSWDMER